MLLFTRGLVTERHCSSRLNVEEGRAVVEMPEGFTFPEDFGILGWGN